GGPEISAERDSPHHRRDYHRQQSPADLPLRHPDRNTPGAHNAHHSTTIAFFAVRQRRAVLVTKRRNVIVHIATSADGYIARPDGDLEWLTSRPAPEGFYGMSAFVKSIDTKVIGRKTYEVSLRMGARFDANSRHIVFSRHAPP